MVLRRQHYLAISSSCSRGTSNSSPSLMLLLSVYNFEEYQFFYINFKSVTQIWLPFFILPSHLVTLNLSCRRTSLDFHYYCYYFNQQFIQSDPSAFEVMQQFYPDFAYSPSLFFIQFINYIDSRYFLNYKIYIMDTTTNSKRQAEGTLFAYNSKGSIAYKTSVKSNKYLLFLDGMWGNILTIPYFYLLKNLCDSNHITLVYPQLRSHPYFQIHRIEEDIEDITDVVNGLNGSVVLLGHSTGCQDSLLYIQHSHSEKVKGIILQAPVSDIEARPDPVIPQLVAKAKENKEEMFCTYAGEVWLRERFLTVLDPYNKEDLFSSYLQDSSFQKWKKQTPVPILSVLGLKDQYCGKNLKHKFEHMGKVEVLEEADHAITGPKEQEKFICIVESFLREINFI